MPDTEMVKVADYCSVIKGKIGIKKALKGKYPLVTTAEDRLSHNEYHFDRPSVIIPLVSSTGHGHASLKRIHYQEGKFAVGSILCAVTPKDENILNAQFLYHYLDVYKEKLLVSRMRGMANVTLPVTEIEDVEFPLLSTDKQKEWVSLFENASSYTNSLTSEIDYQQSLLKKLRQSILQDGVSGKLTEKWRKENPDVEPATELLVRINAEKEQLVKEKKIKKQEPLPPISKEEKPSDLPESWVWLKIEYFLEYKNRGMITGPFGTALQKSEHQPKGIPVFGIETIKNGKFTYKNKIFITPEKSKELSSFSAKSGEIIISRSGTIDEICVIPEDVESGIISTNLLRLSLLGDLVHSTYFCYLFKGSVLVLEKLKELCSGSTRLFLNQKILKALVFPVPPIEEQKAIVAKVEKLLACCDELEQQIGRSQQDSELLMQAVLKEAFES